MYAIVEMAGQQFKVAKDQKVFVHRLDSNEGDAVIFDNVLLIDDNGAITIGAPAIDGASVQAKVLRHLKGDKVIIFKKKRRKGYKVKNGHRQQLTQIQITSITGFSGGAKKSTKETAKPEAAGADRDTVDFGEDHELNYKLKKFNLSQSKENRETLVSLAEGKATLPHAEVDALIEKNIAKFKELKK